MSGETHSDMARACLVCGCKDFETIAVRSDGKAVKGCVECRMGVVAVNPEHLTTFYDDGYYGLNGSDTGDSPGLGYATYAYTGEHSVRWAAEVVNLVRPNGGRVLDIGCADGLLLSKLGPAYTTFGIEVNASAAQSARERGITIIGDDLLDESMVAKYAGSFDVITATAVFEHLSDIRGGIETALRLLRDNGILLFEVPLMSAVHDNTTWLTSSLEHVWYPSESGLRRLVETELGAHLIGSELYIEGYASNYVGVAFSAGADTAMIEGFAERVLMRRSEPTSDQERTARFFLHVVHAATSTHADLDALPLVPVTSLNPNLLRRLSELWQADLWRLGLSAMEVNRVQTAWEGEVAHSRRLAADLDAVISDRTKTYGELTAELLAAQARLDAAWTDRTVRIEADASLKRRRSALIIERQALEARAAQLDAKCEAFDKSVASVAEASARRTDDQAKIAAELAHSQAQLAQHWAVVEEFERSKAWQIAIRVRAFADRFPLIANLGLVVARLALRAARGNLVGRLRRRIQASPEEPPMIVRADTPIALSDTSKVTLTAGKSVRAPSESGAESSPARPPQPAGCPITNAPIALNGTSTVARTAADLISAPSDSAADLSPGGSPQRTQSTPFADAQSTRFAGKVVLVPETGRRSPLATAHHEPGNDWPLVSVVIPSFNYGAFVADAVDSALAQTFTDLEVIVVEGGSSNGQSRLIAAGFERPRTRVLMQGAANWSGANRNFGISQARGRYICCLDADDTLAPTYIEKAVYLLERHGYDIVSGALEMTGLDQGVINILEEPDLRAMLDANNVLCCAVFRREFWERSGGFRDAERTSSGYVYEDWAFWLRLSALGARIRNLHHDPVLRYRVHGRSQSRGKDVPPLWRQRQLVRQMNEDVLDPIPELIVRSRQRTSIHYGTPIGPLAPILPTSPALSAPRQPTLLLAMPFLILGGAERLLSVVVGHLAALGWRVVITTSVETVPELGDTTPWFAEHTREIFHLPRGLPVEMWEDFVHHLVRSRRVDIIWVVGSSFIYDCLRGLRAAFPHLRVADLLFNTVGHTANNRRRRHLIDVTFVESNEVARWLIDHGEEPARVRVVESGIDVLALYPRGRSEALVAQIGAAAGDLIVGFAGRWSEEKNPLGFIEIARLVDRAVPVRFVMTGTGPMRPAIERAIEGAVFPDGRFHVLGAVPDVAPVLASFDLLVVPSLLDGRPVVVLEALASGVPVLASRVGGLPDLIEDGATGWLREPHDSNAFAGCIEYAEANRAELRAMRVRAREHAERLLGREQMLEQYESGLKSLLPVGLTS
jgi:glycosyltransferase involved in cell wall biosynthesis/SAM-dependent methyltransferase